ncbi:MAG: Precorrin-6A reductase [uncultured Propionibacteriaceae bacterium]|uniref:Precorrin-6A reductase n=1 Tax=uncultured Propionibacteriaceae bacterium TaxID=257457 RepID=A0A6J4PI37_9ACTN|nr:MAG: Precorrin-6A reductase [uncultured Propionibacteriaceae bacterium]
MTILILGGTAEARALARDLVALDFAVLSSLAGRVAQPALPAGDLRIGGFGGPHGLVRFLQDRRRHDDPISPEYPRAITAIVDATHPFAAQMSHHAALAAAETGIPLLRLARSGWRSHALADQWCWVPDLATARAAAEPALRPFLTTGRQSLPAFEAWSDRRVVVRLVDPPGAPLPARWQLFRSRGPYTHQGERQLMTDHAVDVLITKDSGGDYTVAKLEVATELAIPVVVVSRPAPEPGVETVTTVEAAVGWVRSRVE